MAATCFGATEFVEPCANAGFPDEDRYLGIRDLYAKFEGVRDRRGVDEGWGLALLEMLTDPMLKQWVPAWVVEQYRRGNPFCQEVLTALQAENLQSNKALLKKTKREMIRRHRRHLQKISEKKGKGGQESSGEGRAVQVKEKVRRTSVKMLTGRRMSWPPDSRASGMMTLTRSQWNCCVMRVHRPVALSTVAKWIQPGPVVRPKSV